MASAHDGLEREAVDGLWPVARRPVMTPRQADPDAPGGGGQLGRCPGGSRGVGAPQGGVHTPDGSAGRGVGAWAVWGGRDMPVSAPPAAPELLRAPGD